jgi:hypothetical protein
MTRRYHSSASSDGSSETKVTGVPTNEAAGVKADVEAQTGRAALVTPQYGADGKFNGKHDVTSTTPPRR